MDEKSRNTSAHSYDDIIGLPRPVSRRHAPMPLKARAAQFSPYAALSGYEELLAESENALQEVTGITGQGEDWEDLSN